MAFSIASPCGSRGTKNRVPVENLAGTGRCGVCKAPLPPANEPIEADASSFDEIIAGAKVPVLVDFWAPWCGACRMAAPEVQQLAREMGGRALVIKVDTEAYLIWRRDSAFNPSRISSFFRMVKLSPSVRA